jgi:hypothetical protein
MLVHALTLSLNRISVLEAETDGALDNGIGRQHKAMQANFKNQQRGKVWHEAAPNYFVWPSPKSPHQRQMV